MSKFSELYGVARKHTSKEQALALATKHYRQPENRIQTLSLEMSDNSIIKKADGNTYIEGVLTDIFKDTEGYAPTEEFAKKIVDQINNVGIDAFITHESLDKHALNYGHLSDKDFIDKLREREGLLDNIKAIYEKGKVWIKGLVKSSFIDKIKDITKMSIELIVPPSNVKDGKYIDGDVVGLALDNNAKNKRATFKLKKG